MGTLFSKRIEYLSTKIQTTTVEDLITLIDEKLSFILIDVREDFEWSQGFIPNAIHISRGKLEFNIEKIAPNHNLDIILYCGSGIRSLLAADSLNQMGYQKVSSLKGGFQAWLTSRSPLEMRTD